MNNLEKHLEKASSAKRESKYVDFKEDIDLTSTRDWCEIIKDILAMANSGGGVILIGVRNDGTPSGANLKNVLRYDPADVTNKIASYTNQQFADFDILPIQRNGKRVAALVIGGADMPIVFTKPGTYPVSDKDQRRAFSVGTVYFRHGAKSEPGTTDDLRRFIERKVEQTRRSWLAGVRKVIKAPAGAVVSLVAPHAVPGPLQARVVSDTEAPGVIPQNADEIWPYRQTDVIKMTNAQLKGQARINSFDIQCVRKVYKLDETRPEFVYRPYQRAAPQYSKSFVGWLVTQYQKNPNFFEKNRDKYKSMD